MNLIRVAYQALAAVLGGCQSLHTNSMDETLALPSEHAVTLALRTQQVLAHETGVTNTVDPLGGSFFVETLTRQMQQEANKVFDRIDELGGMLAAIDRGYFRREIAEAAFAYQRKFDARHKIVVGVNAYQESDEKPLEILTIDHAVESEQIAALRRVKQLRSQDDVAARFGRSAPRRRGGRKPAADLARHGPRSRHGGRGHAGAGRRVRPLRFGCRVSLSDPLFFSEAPHRG